MRVNWREVAAALAPGALLALWTLAAVAIFVGTLGAPERGAFYALVEARIALILMA